MILGFLFQSTHPCGVRQLLARRRSISRGFNPRTRVGCDSSDKKRKSTTKVSIHAPVWGATVHFKDSMDSRSQFQSTHPCGVRQYNKTTDKAWYVSIHAPVWGATTYIERTRQGQDVSIHAPVWGATPVIHLLTAAHCFNPRTRVGCDQPSPSGKRYYERFNPRTRVGCDRHNSQLATSY